MKKYAEEDGKNVSTAENVGIKLHKTKRNSD